MVKISLLLPTRKRSGLVHRFLESVADNADDPGQIEVVLGVDDDDEESQKISFTGLALRRAVGVAGRTMGALNRACYDASSGRFVMLVNDDIVVRTRGWDRAVLEAIASLPDEICLVHVNDLLFRERLCTFPLLSRAACERIGLCPEGYRRYRIDDHIYDIYQLLARLGERRILHLPDVVFEHQNHVAQGGVPCSAVNVFRSEDQKVYVPDQEVIERDAALFDATFEDRKASAFLLADEIERLRQERRRERWATTLSWTPDSLSYRHPGFVRSMATGPGRPRPRTTVAVSTADTGSAHAARCLRALKEHTTDFDLIVLDNNRDPGFSHPRDMNEVLSATRTDYLVFLDDDVFVEAGWLEGLHAALDRETAVALPLHVDGSGALAFSGCHLAGDGRGTHMHLVDRIAAPRETPCYCSAIMLLDLTKIGELRMDESYSKYFFDIVHGLEVWERGFGAVVTPAVTVTHLGGATAVRGTAETNQHWRRDGEHFAALWESTGRLRALEERRWRARPFLRELVEAGRVIEDAFRVLAACPAADLTEIALSLLVANRDRPAFVALVASELSREAERATSVGDATRARCCGAVLSWIGTNAARIGRQPDAQVAACGDRVRRFLARAGEAEVRS